MPARRHGRRGKPGSGVASSPRAVFDCMVFLQGTARRESPSGACLRLFERGHITLYVSEAVLSEVEGALSRPKLQQKFPALQGGVTRRLIEELRHRAILVKEVPESLRYERDPKDEPYLNLALASGAEYLVTWDSDLLDLEEPKSEAGRALREKLPGARLLDPVAFLRELAARR
jgi:uncharacterized protein